MPRDSRPAGPAKLTNCHRFTIVVPARLPVDALRMAQRVMVVAQRAVSAARPEGVLGGEGSGDGIRPVYAEALRSTQRSHLDAWVAPGPIATSLRRTLRNVTAAIHHAAGRAR